MIISISLLLLSSIVMSGCGQENTSTTNQIENKCIIIVDEQKYDVTAFKKIHKGGDVFDCDSDMSDKFHQRHGAEILLKVANLKI